MFVLKPEEFGDKDHSNAKQFIAHWGQYYIDTPPHVIDDNGQKMNDKIDYISELNTGSNLTDQNVTRLLRWKLWRAYTHPDKDGNPNPQVTIVLLKIRELNLFRNNELSEDAFKRVAEQLIPTDGTMRIFLFHICRPWEYPIADQHVFRGFYLLEGEQLKNKIDVTWEIYKNSYIPFFRQIAEKYCERPKPQEGMTRYIKDLKEIDNALMSFGQFLGKYNRT
jgi:hypothetical protein